jgi:hypothetical protein
MNAAQKDNLTVTGDPWDEILDAVRSEPALSWLLAQAVWMAQPALEAFWARERIETLAESLESALAFKGGTPRPPTDGGAMA